MFHVIFLNKTLLGFITLKLQKIKRSILFFCPLNKQREYSMLNFERKRKSTQNRPVVINCRGQTIIVPRVLKWHPVFSKLRLSTDRSETQLVKRAVNQTNMAVPSSFFTVCCLIWVTSPVPSQRGNVQYLLFYYRISCLACYRLMLNRNSTVSDWVCRCEVFPTLCDNGVLLEEFGARSTLVYIYWHGPRTRRDFNQI